jgi:hypothetical protein
MNRRNLLNRICGSYASDGGKLQNIKLVGISQQVAGIMQSISAAEEVRCRSIATNSSAPNVASGPK